LGFFMQFVDGPNLRQWGPGAFAEVDQILEMLLEVGETLAHSHGRHVLHRDVKPENILLQMANGVVKAYLSDFDLSWFSTATKLTRLAGDGFGSHFYAAPEQMNAPASPAAHRASVDVYSFGQVMYFALTGRDPAVLDQAGNLRAFNERLGSMPMSGEVARQLSKLYTDCTEPSPDRRLAEFRELCNRLSRALALLRAPDEELTPNRFLSELRFLVSGSMTDDKLFGSVNFRSPSARTEVVLIVKSSNQQHASFEASLIPTQSPVLGGGGNAANARQAINSRIDGALQKYVSEHNARRHSPKGGAYQCVMTFEKIPLNSVGLSTSRELLMAAVDCIERV
jgi:eukaryotic-like serine/threonine-protein kinase